MSSTPQPEIVRQTFEATLYAPLFYASREGNVRETDPVLSSTALSHALGYTYYDLQKDYVLLGDAATTPTYDRLCELPFFVSDMTPVEARASERTFRSTGYTNEHNLSTSDGSVAKMVGDNSKGIPKIRGKSSTGWHEVREFTGLEPGSKYEFTVWSTDPLPESLAFQMGIKRSGEFRANEVSRKSSSVILNRYLLERVYDVSAELLADAIEHSETFERGNDPRKHHLHGVDIEFIDESLAPTLLDE